MKVFVIVEHHDYPTVIGVFSSLTGAVDAAEKYVESISSLSRPYRLDEDEACAMKCPHVWCSGGDFVRIEEHSLQGSMSRLTAYGLTEEQAEDLARFWNDLHGGCAFTPEEAEATLLAGLRSGVFKLEGDKFTEMASGRVLLWSEDKGDVWWSQDYSEWPEYQESAEC